MKVWPGTWFCFFGRAPSTARPCHFRRPPPVAFQACLLPWSAQGKRAWRVGRLLLHAAAVLGLFWCAHIACTHKCIVDHSSHTAAPLAAAIFPAHHPFACRHRRTAQSNHCVISIGRRGMRIILLPQASSAPNNRPTWQRAPPMCNLALLNARLWGLEQHTYK